MKGFFDMGSKNGENVVGGLVGRFVVVVVVVVETVVTGVVLVVVILEERGKNFVASFTCSVSFARHSLESELIKSGISRFQNAQFSCRSSTTIEVKISLRSKS
jgi:hypothetical protein